MGQQCHVGKLRPRFCDTIGQYLPNGTIGGVCYVIAENSVGISDACNAIVFNGLWLLVVRNPNLLARSGTAIAPYEFRPGKLPSGGQTVGIEKLNGRVSRSASNVPGPEMGRLCVGRIRVRGGSALFLCANTGVFLNRRFVPILDSRWMVRRSATPCDRKPARLAVPAPAAVSPFHSAHL